MHVNAYNGTVCVREAVCVNVCMRVCVCACVREAVCVHVCVRARMCVYCTRAYVRRPLQPVWVFPPATQAAYRRKGKKRHMSG